MSVQLKKYSQKITHIGLAALITLTATALISCKPKDQAPPQMPPQEVSVIKLVPRPVTISEEYVAQAEAKDTVEIRARVGGILERQAFEDGAHVKKGQTLYVIDQEPYKVALAQAKAALAQAKAGYVNAQRNLTRVRPLADGMAVSQQDLDAAVASEDAARAQVEAAEAGVRQAELNLGYTTVTAPRDGDITNSLVRPGSLISAATTLLATVYSVDPMYINTTVSESRMQSLNRQYGGNGGGPAIRVLMVDGSEYGHTAKINYTGAAVDKQTGTLAVRVSVPNPERQLKPGQFVRLVFPEATLSSAIMVPLQSVQETQDVKTVLVVGPNGVVEARQIKGGRTSGNELLVEDGLKAGETIIVEGTAKAKPGTPVKPVPMSGAPETGAQGAAGQPGQKKAAR